jgi:hypothetical protein
MKARLLSMKPNLPEINSRHALQFPSGWPAACRIYFSIRQQQQTPPTAQPVSVRYPVCQQALLRLKRIDGSGDAKKA